MQLDEEMLAMNRNALNYEYLSGAVGGSIKELQFGDWEEGYNYVDELIPGIESTVERLFQPRKSFRDHCSKHRELQILTQMLLPKNVYKRKEVAFEEFIKTPERRVPGYVDENLYQGVRVTDVFDDQNPGRMIGNPRTPHANEDGMKQMPNVDVSREND